MSSNSAFSVYKAVKEIFLEFSRNGEGYTGYIDYEDLQHALSAAMDEDVPQDEIEEALESFRQPERSSENEDHDHSDDAVTLNSRGQQKISMSKFLVLMQHLEFNGQKHTDAPQEPHGTNKIGSSQTAPNPTIASEGAVLSLSTETSGLLYPHRKILCIQKNGENAKLSKASASRHDEDFVAAFPPTQMHYLALVSHNGMKSTMKRFVLANKNIIKKFCLTGTNSTMTMLREVIGDDPEVVYGPSCSSGPLGGDAELSALMSQGKLGGVIFFQDPMSAHPHQADIDSLNRLALVHNTMIVNNPTTAVMMMDVLRSALKGPGRPELIPSFFLTMVSPSVAAYQAAQKVMILQSIADEASVASTMTGSAMSTAGASVRQSTDTTSAAVVKAQRPRTQRTNGQASRKSVSRLPHSRPASRSTSTQDTAREPHAGHLNVITSVSSESSSSEPFIRSNLPSTRRPVTSSASVGMKKNRVIAQKAITSKDRAAFRMTTENIDWSGHTAETEQSDLSTESGENPAGEGDMNFSTIVVKKALGTSRRRSSVTALTEVSDMSAEELRGKKGMEVPFAIVKKMSPTGKTTNMRKIKTSEGSARPRWRM